MDTLERDKFTVEELRRIFDAHSNSSDILDQKAGSLLSSSTLVIGLFTALQLPLIDTNTHSLYILGLSLVFILYLGLISLSTSVFWPRDFKLPIKSDWDTISIHLLSLDTQGAILKMINAYTEQNPFNHSQNIKKAKRVRIASFLMAFIIAMMLILTFF